MLRILRYAGICNNNNYPSLQLQTATTGVLGENEAAKYLKKRGWRILSRNSKVGHLEIDIIAMSPDESTLSLVEVRSTASLRKSPEFTIGREKRRHLMRIGNAYITEAKKHDLSLSISIIAVTICENESYIKFYPHSIFINLE